MQYTHRPTLYIHKVTIAQGLVFASASYLFFLCFINTNVFRVTDGMIGLAELGIIGCIILLCRQYRASIVVPVLMITGYLILLWAMRGTYDLKAPRNIAIIVAFFYLGKYVGPTYYARQAVLWICYFVFAFVLIEYFFTSPYLNVINIQAFYYDRLGDEAPEYLGENLFASGIRPFGRTLFPFLGQHRVSSIFLEPVSMGNFAMVLMVYGLSFSKENWKTGTLFIFWGFVFATFADSRFAAFAFVPMLLLRLVPMLHHAMIVATFPFIFCAGIILYSWAMNIPTGLAYDNLPGRLLISGNFLRDMPFDHFLGLSVPRNLYDAGFAHVFETYGILLAAMLWGSFVLICPTNWQGRCYKALLAFYIMALLSVSGTSLFAMKTAGLLWFLMGTMSVNLNIAQSKPLQDDHKTDTTEDTKGQRATSP
jgi:putative polymerase